MIATLHRQHFYIAHAQVCLTDIMQQLFRDAGHTLVETAAIDALQLIDPKQNFFQHAIELHSELIGIEDFEKDILTLLMSQVSCVTS